MKSFVIQILFLCMLTACSQTNSEFENEANAICRIYTPESLQATAGMDLLTKFEFVNTKIRNTVKSKEFNAIFEKLAREGYADFYAALQQEVSALIGTQWTCDNAKAFYSITWQRADPQQEETVIQISVIDGKFYTINGANYAFSEVDKIKQAIDSAAQGKDFKLDLYIPSATSREALNKYLEPLRKMGIKKLSVVEK